MHKMQLRKAHIDARNGKPPRDLAQIHRDLDRAEHFMFTATPDDDDAEIAASIEAMKATGAWRLPYPICSFEFRAEITVNGRPEIKPQPEWFIVLLVEGEPDFIRHTFVRASSHAWCLADEPSSRHDAARIVGACLVALCTRGIRRDRWIANRQAAPGRPEPRGIAYTKVHIQEALAGGNATMTERRRVRLHLRRGHTRQQPYGPGRQQIRLIFIEPCLVGYADDGEIHHTQYQVR
jgi:hypothetical protein